MTDPLQSDMLHQQPSSPAFAGAPFCLAAALGNPAARRRIDALGDVPQPSLAPGRADSAASRGMNSALSGQVCEGDLLPTKGGLSLSSCDRSGHGADTAERVLITIV